MRARYPFVLAAVLVSTAAIAQPTGVPSPANSTVPTVVATAPGGNFVTVVIVRDLANNPVINSTVVLDYNNCPGFTPCSQPGPSGDNYVVNPVAKTISMLSSGPLGQAPFYLRAGGGCSANGIRIFADGVLLAQVHAASVDQNGDLSVDGADIALVHGKIGTSDLSGDIDGNFVVDANDESLVTSHAGNNCLDPTDVRRPTWGRLKTIYR